ncbi:MAG: phosphatidate cytidylyltransferase [Holosporaceae bacterium]|jgi:phosphatidate cytidylyltransferase|nr:phosphatidate cytidylyltransferase [Holosporaceae bacterium]
MESSAIERENVCVQRKEFVHRLFSSCLFILAAILLFRIPYGAFSILCWGAFAFMIFEILSPKIKGKFWTRIIATIVCFGGIQSFIYCREFLGELGCAFLICISSFTDIGAYSFGKILGGSKLCPKISPNKTWAGFWGGIVFANISFYCLKAAFFSKGTAFPSLGFADFWTVQAVILAAVVGDLLESWFKRAIKVKDMGKLFPGHGGVLDRLDSLLLASIVLAILDFLH